MNGLNHLAQFKLGSMQHLRSKIAVQSVDSSNHLCCMSRAKLLLWSALASPWMNGGVNEVEGSCVRRLAGFVYGDSLWLDSLAEESHRIENLLYCVCPGFVSSKAGRPADGRRLRDMRSQNERERERKVHASIFHFWMPVYIWGPTAFCLGSLQFISRSS